MASSSSSSPAVFGSSKSQQRLADFMKAGNPKLNSTKTYQYFMKYLEANRFDSGNNLPKEDDQDNIDFKTLIKTENASIISLLIRIAGTHLRRRKVLRLDDSILNKSDSIGNNDSVTPDTSKLVLDLYERVENPSSHMVLILDRIRIKNDAKKDIDLTATGRALEEVLKPILFDGESPASKTRKDLFLLETISRATESRRFMSQLAGVITKSYNELMHGNVIRSIWKHSPVEWRSLRIHLDHSFMEWYVNDASKFHDTMVESNNNMSPQGTIFLWKAPGKAEVGAGKQKLGIYWVPGMMQYTTTAENIIDLSQRFEEFKPVSLGVVYLKDTSDGSVDVDRIDLGFVASKGQDDDNDSGDDDYDRREDSDSGRSDDEKDEDEDYKSAIDNSLASAGVMAKRKQEKKAAAAASNVPKKTDVLHGVLMSVIKALATEYYAAASNGDQHVIRYSAAVSLNPGFRLWRFKKTRLHQTDGTEAKRRVHMAPWDTLIREKKETSVHDLISMDSQPSVYQLIETAGKFETISTSISDVAATEPAGE